MKKLILSFCLLFVLVGCSPNVEIVPYSTSSSQPVDTEQVVTEQFVTDVRGYKYRLISPDITNENGTVTVELWERIEPLVTNRWYTRDLSSRLDPEKTPMFNSISK